jgi:hypothetical protein
LVWSAENLNKLAFVDMTRQSFPVRGLILGIFLLGLPVWFGLQNLNNMAVWFGLQNLNKLVLGAMTTQNFQVRGLILGIFFDLVWFGGLIWSAKLEQVGAWRYD